MQIITRAQWGARYDRGFGSAPLPAAEVWLHHSVTLAPDLVWIDADRDGVEDDEERAMRTLEQIGEDRFGGGISYTFAVMPSGRIYEGHGVDRQGAHTRGRNDIARAIVLVGDYSVRPPTDAQRLSVALLLQHGQTAGWWRHRQLAGGHRQAPGASTACPGDAGMAAIPHINQLAAGGPITEEDALPTPNDVWMAPCTGVGPDGKAQTHPAVAWVTVMAFRIAAIEKATAQLAGRSPVDVDEAAVAANLAPMLVDALSGQLSELGPDDLQRIATAVADEQARRQAA